MKPTRIRVSGVVINNRRIALIHRKKGGYEYYVCPGGGIEEGESGEEAVIREVKEETGLTCLEVRYAFDYIEDKNGNKHPYYFCEVKDEKVVLGGPEAARNSEDNWYHPEWIDLKKIKELNLLPGAVKEKLIEILETK